MSLFTEQRAEIFGSTFTAANGCDSVYTVKPLQVVNTIEDTILRNTQPPVLTTSGNAQFYPWTPAIQLSNPNMQSPSFSGTPGSYSRTPATSLNNAEGINPIATPLSTTTYTVKGQDLNGCKNKDSVIVIEDLGDGMFYTPNAFIRTGFKK